MLASSSFCEILQLLGPTPHAQALHQKSELGGRFRSNTCGASCGAWARLKCSKVPWWWSLGTWAIQTLGRQSSKTSAIAWLRESEVLAVPMTGSPMSGRSLLDELMTCKPHKSQWETDTASFSIITSGMWIL